jgi:hypothetical protein
MTLTQNTYITLAGAQLVGFTSNQRYMIQGMNILDSSTVFTDVQDAILAIQQKQAEQMTSEEFMFHVQAKCPQGDGSHMLCACDLGGTGDVDGTVECYQTFNHTTGQYEEFATFESAKIRCQELRLERVTLVYASYYVLEEVQQINEQGEPITEWVVCDVGDALQYK